MIWKLRNFCLVRFGEHDDGQQDHAIEEPGGGEEFSDSQEPAAAEVLKEHGGCYHREPAGGERGIGMQGDYGLKVFRFW